ncbi:hydroxyacid dehydrogenase [Croceicoccus estronivorus]|uniref:2-hydroxyacid dehydrogenase n=1 Tax=Croceicoccus estronivorus TaxID=1172626 RepID=UPI000835428D|nr:2-hydroxyacid dehydrogenase [Croceicoccus estronivorus]OCC25009.1 hydroxyacid dehydrogenase [Croceicoccus estronivorus]
MRVAVFGTRKYDRAYLSAANTSHQHELVFYEADMDSGTVPLAAKCDAVCVFVNDVLDATVLKELAALGIKLVALRCAGFNNVDLAAAASLGIDVVRVPAYSPHAVAEFSIGLLLALDRKIHRAWARTRENNFSLDGMVGRNLHGRVVGVIGTGRIGAIVARILQTGFGCRVLAADLTENPELKAAGVEYVSRETLLREAEIVTLHCPLTPDSRHLIDSTALDMARPGLLLINTSRGGLIDTIALIEALKSGKVGGVALDVYEQEGDLFFRDLSDEIVQDDIFQRLLTFPNVLVTGHQAFLTQEALAAIAQTTLANLSDAEAGRELTNRVTQEMVR